MAKRDEHFSAARRESSQLRAAVEFAGHCSNSIKSITVAGLGRGFNRRQRHGRYLPTETIDAANRRRVRIARFR